MKKYKRIGWVVLRRLTTKDPWWVDYSKLDYKNEVTKKETITDWCFYRGGEKSLFNKKLARCVPVYVEATP